MVSPPFDAPPPADDPVEKHRARASLLLSLNRAEDAAREISAALSLAPNDAHLLCLMTNTQSKLFGSAASLSWADRAVAADPQEAWAHSLRCFALMALNRVDEAKAAARACCELEPGNPLVYHNLVDVCIAESKWDEANAAALRGRDLDPSREMAFLDLARVCTMQAGHYEKSANKEAAQTSWDEAENAARHALFLLPNDSLGLEMLGHILVRRADTGGAALPVFAALSQIDPQSPAAQDYLKRAVQTRFSFATPAGVCATLMAWVMEAILLWGLAMAPLQAALWGSVCAVLFALGFLRFGGGLLMARQKAFRAMPSGTQRALRELFQTQWHAHWWHTVQWAMLLAFLFPFAAQRFSLIGAFWSNVGR